MAGVAPTIGSCQYIHVHCKCIIIKYIAFQLCLDRGENGFGFSMTGDRPAHIRQIAPGSAADVRGLQVNDVIVEIDGHDVTALTTDTVARVLRCVER